MVRASNKSIVITPGELDEIMILLEYGFCNTGDQSIFQVISILMADTNKQIIEQQKL